MLYQAHDCAVFNVLSGLFILRYTNIDAPVSIDIDLTTLWKLPSKAIAARLSLEVYYGGGALALNPKFITWDVYQSAIGKCSDLRRTLGESARVSRAGYAGEKVYPEMWKLQK